MEILPNWNINYFLYNIFYKTYMYISMQLALFEFIILIGMTIYFLNKISRLNKINNFYIQQSINLDKENQILRKEKSAMKKFLALDKSINW
jgi:hypothetical protein